jgi:hypothetical protein
MSNELIRGQAEDVRIFSFSDMGVRVMRVLSAFTPNIEISSIDGEHCSESPASKPRSKQ